MTDLKKRKVGLFRFGLLTLLIAVLLVGLICNSRPVVQLRVRQEIRHATGGDSLTAASTSRPISEIKAEIVSDAFDDVHSMFLADVPAQRHWIRAMKDWDKLSTLWLNRSGATDNDLRYLANHTQLQELYLNGNQQITDQGVRNLGYSAILRRLELNYTQVRDLSRVAESFPGLQILKLRGTRISDSDLLGLRGMVHLSQLDLSRTRVTNSGLETLTSLPQLQFVVLHETQTNDDGVRGLQSRLPNCVVQSADGTVFTTGSFRAVTR